jgi:hypothetical protein
MPNGVTTQRDPDGNIVTRTRKNRPQRALRGIRIGLPRHNTGWLVFVPSTNYHSVDVYFDANFESTLAFTNSRFPGYIDAVITDANPLEDLDVERTGSPFGFLTKNN